MTERATAAATNPSRDRQRQSLVAVVLADLADLQRAADLAGRHDPDRLDEIRWMIEELRVSVFAQRLGTAHPVSVARIQAAMDALDPPP
jgi:ATP-dependent helicase HrpA